MLKQLRNAFFSGLIMLAPLGVTIVVVKFLLENIGEPASNLFFSFLHDSGIRNNPVLETLIQIASTLVVIALITVIGYLSNYVFGKMVLRATERAIDRLPFVGTVYNTVKQIVDTFSKQKKAVFQKVVLLEFPRKGIYAIGFLTNDAQGEVQAKTQHHLCSIFVPTTPNPTSGFLVLVPTSELISLEMTVPEGMKLIISGGAVTPPYPNAQPLPVTNPTGTAPL